MKLYIQYMVSRRCKVLVKEDLRKLGLQHVFLEFGIIEILEEMTDQRREQIRAKLLQTGWELLNDKKSILIEKIKNVVMEMVALPQEVKVNYSEYISKKLGYDYTYLANIFSEVKGTTIRQYIITQKIDKVKELLLYDDLNLKEISYKLGYSSVAHLSGQFKQMTGLTPSYYKELKKRRHDAFEPM